MDSSEYLEALIGEKNSLDPSYHVNAVRLLNEGNESKYQDAALPVGDQRSTSQHVSYLRHCLRSCTDFVCPRSEIKHVSVYVFWQAMSVPA